MIQITIEDADIKQIFVGTMVRYTVEHPNNDAVLARCDTRAEAVAVREAFNDLARQLRGIGFKVK